MKIFGTSTIFSRKIFQRTLSTTLVLLFIISYHQLVIHVYLPSDIDECKQKAHSCSKNALCINTPSAYECKCTKGFFGDGWECKDLNECTQLRDPCWPNSKCNNIFGGYSCECLPGFKENASHCIDIDECLNSPCNKNAVCTNTIGSYKCQCKQEFEGDGFSCVRANRECKVPTNHNFQRCAEKVEWMKRFWKSHSCYERNGADGTVCSFLRYLSEVEHHCPLMPGRQPRDRKSRKALVKARNDKDNIRELFQVVRAENNFNWIRDRISSMWGEWIAAMKSLTAKQNMDGREKKQILVFIGALADKAWAWAENAKKGGPLGELVQWADLIAGLYFLGHDLYVSANVRELLTSSGAGTNPCGDDAVGLTEFDLIYTDIHGLQLLQKNGFDVSALKCKYRILDSFGTEARFNFMDPIEESELSFNGSFQIANTLRQNPYGYGNWKLHLNQFLTMFPHTPDNSFLGFVVGKETSPKINMSKKEDVALVYGKQNYMWQGKYNYLSAMSKFVKVHATVTSDVTGAQPASKPSNAGQLGPGLFNIPNFVHNHGLMDWNRLQLFLESVKIFIGLGFPFEGPAPLEAMSKGCVFINPEFSPGLNRLNDIKINRKLFFEGKPTLRNLQSQHPYLEQFVGKPHIWTVNTDDNVAVENTVKQILQAFKEGQIKPYLPYEFTHEGLLQRLNAYVSHQDFCNPNQQWPPSTALQVRIGNKGESCMERCKVEGFLCDNSLFKQLNSESTVKSSGASCTQFVTKKTLFAPYIIDDGTCVLQGEPLAFSCVDAADKYRRLCPCRDFIKGQVSLCKDCT